MVGGPTVESEWHPVVQGPGQVVATVVVNREPDVEHKEGQLRQGMAAEEVGVDAREQGKGQHLRGSRVFCG